MSPNIQILIGIILIASCAVGAFFGSLMVKSGIDKKREQFTINQSPKDSPMESESNIKAVKVKIKRILEDANSWLEKAIEQNETQTNKIKSTFNKSGVFHGGRHILAHINRINNFVNLVNDNVKRKVKREIEDLLITQKEEKFENINWLKDEYQKYLEFIKVSERAKGEVKRQNNELAVIIYGTSAFEAILKENPYRE
jgi:predicted metal-dependent hydrolase